MLLQHHASFMVYPPNKLKFTLYRSPVIFQEKTTILTLGQRGCRKWSTMIVIFVVHQTQT